MTISSDLSANFKNKKGYQRLIKVMLGNWIHHLSGVCLESQGKFFVCCVVIITREPSAIPIHQSVKWIIFTAEL